MKDLINKIHCRDCLDLLKEIPDNVVDLIIIDPPYILIEEKWDKQETINSILSKELFRVAKDNCSFYIWCSIGEKNQCLIKWFSIFNEDWYFKDLITWKKQRGMGTRKGWLYTREEIMWFVKDNSKFIWNKELQYDLTDKRLFSLPNNKSDYKRWSNVWTDIKEEAGGMKSAKFHPTQKPIKAMERIIKLHTKKDDLILDCFAGSFTTALAAEELGRNWICCDNLQEYCDVGQKRLDELRSKN